MNSFPKKLLNQILDSYKSLITTIQENLGVTFDTNVTATTIVDAAVAPVASVCGTATQAPSVTIATPTPTAPTDLKTKNRKKKNQKQGLLQFPDGGTSNAGEADLLDHQFSVHLLADLKPTEMLMTVSEKSPISGNNPYKAEWNNKVASWRGVLLKTLAIIDMIPMQKKLSLESIAFPVKSHKRGKDVARKPAQNPFHLIDPKTRKETHITARGHEVVTLRCLDDAVLAFPMIFKFGGYDYAMTGSYNSKAKIEVIHMLLHAVNNAGFKTTLTVKY